MVTGAAIEGSANVGPVRVFISYAHDSDEHVDHVRSLWVFLRQNRIDARLDLPAAERRNDWPLWMLGEMRAARYVLVVASPAYKRRAEGDAKPDEGRGVQFEAALVREEVYQDRAASLDRIVPVILPGGTADDIPAFLGPHTTTHYTVRDFTVAGAEKLLRLLTGQAYETEPPLGDVPVLPSRSIVSGTGGLRTEVVVDLSMTDGRVVSTVSVAGTRLGETDVLLPDEVASVWQRHDASPQAADERLARVGRLLTAVLFDEVTAGVVGDLANGLRPGQTLEVVLVAEGAALILPIELARLVTSAGVDLGPLAQRPGVVVRRRPRDIGDYLPRALPGPLKVLAAVAAPAERPGGSPMLDVEAEMEAVLDCTTDLGAEERAEVRILEVASLDQIVAAVRDDEFHVLHLSAHGSPDSIELEDEDGNRIPVSAPDLLDALRDTGREVPLVVLSSCSGGSESRGLAMALARAGAGYVVAMQAPVTDRYATELAHAFYRRLAARQTETVGAALAYARRDVEAQRRRAKTGEAMPEWGLATLFTAGTDAPLVDPTLPTRPLKHRTLVPSGTSVRELPVGRLIGRRSEMRTACAVLRRTPAARDHWGATSGVVLEGPGGIGKTALAGRLVTRLREDGYRYAVHEGRWNPTALLAAVHHAIADAPELAGAAARLADPAVDDADKLDVVRALLRDSLLLVVFDDFEQNLTPGGEAFLDPALDNILTSLCHEARTGTILITCRYPLPGQDRLLVRVPVPALSTSELRRLLLRLPALRDLPLEARQAIVRAIGGHPRLIEFVDALVRGGRPALHDTAIKLRELAAQHGVDLSRPRPVGQALDEAVLLGSADILLTELIALLTPVQNDVLRQMAVTRAPLTLDDLAFALDDHEPDPNRLAQLDHDARHLTDLTLLSHTDGELLIHPWTADAVARTVDTDLTGQHERALATRLRRLARPGAGFGDLVDVSRHLAALQHYGELVGFANQVIHLLPGTLAVAAFLAEVRPLLPIAAREFALVAEMEMRALLAAGNLHAAQQLAEQIHGHAVDRAAAGPANAEWQRDLSISHNRLGDLAVARGDLAQAAGQFQAGLAIRERLAAADPANTQWQRDLSISHNKLGDLAVARGDLAQAAGQFQAGLAIAERPAAADPANTEWQRDLSISHNRLGDLAVARGDLAQAAGQFQAGLAIAERLAAADPANAQWQRDLDYVRVRLDAVRAPDAGGD